MPARPDYGIDAPYVVRNLLLAGAGCVGAAVLVSLTLRASHPQLAASLTMMLLWPGVSVLFSAGFMLWGSKVGKLRMRDRLLATIPWRGDERVLDVGCGRGLLLCGAAKRLTTGTAIGIDLWQAEDLTGNTAAATLANAEAEGVAGKVEVRTADARQLPFADGEFDVVVSSSAIHNIYDAAGRRQALAEIVRVLKPGGRVAIFDIRHTADYARAFGDMGLADVRRSGPTFVFVIPARTVTGRKPGG
jgi:SAM-dependent methyltransferase